MSVVESSETEAGCFNQSFIFSAFAHVCVCYVSVLFLISECCFERRVCIIICNNVNPLTPTVAIWVPL